MTFSSLIPEQIQKKLQERRIFTPDELLRRGKTFGKRRELAKALGIGKEKLLEYVSITDILRISSVNENTAFLLTNA